MEVPARIAFSDQFVLTLGGVSKNHKFTGLLEQLWQSGLWVSICSERHFKNPMISMSSKTGYCSVPEQPSKIEAAYSMLDQGLSVLTQELALIS